MIPNSEDGGNWESFDAHADLYAVNSTNDASDKTWGMIVYTYFDHVQQRCFTDPDSTK